jgi:tetratricopeptide (TPR) repeat protein
MPIGSPWTRSLAGFALLSSFSLSAAAQPAWSAEPGEPVAGELWEQEIREQLRRDILSREQELWTGEPPVSDPIGPEPAARDSAGQPTATSPAAAAKRSTERAPQRAQGPASRLEPRTRRGASGLAPFSPLTSLAERIRAASRNDPATGIELSTRIAIDRALGLRAEALERAEIAARITPYDETGWLRLAVLQSEAGQRIAARRSLERAASIAPVELSLLATLAEPPAAGAARPGVHDVAARKPSTLEGIASLARERLAFGLSSDALLAGLGILLLGLAALVLRRRGDLTVQIVYPQELRGTFRVRIDGNPMRAERRRPASEPEILKGGTASGRDHQLVARETSFPRLPCRRYHVTVDGVLQDPRDGSSVAHPFLQGSATVLHRRTVRLDMDATPGACPVDVDVLWDGREVTDALVAARGHPGGSVETVNGRARLHLPPGEYLIVAGGGDRVAEHPIQVRSHLPTQLAIDLSRNEGIVFKACPPAVEPYLSGQLEAAAEELTRDGQPAQAHLLLGRRCREHGRIEEAALHFEAAGSLEQAAELQNDLGNYAHAGELFERSHDLLSAAEMYQLSGQEVRAGRAFEAARDFENAIACYRAAGDIASWVEALDRHGDIFEAARTALDNGLPTRGIRLLHRVSPEDPSYREACVMLADTFERESHFDLAARKLADYVGAAGKDEVEPKMYSRLAELHEKAGDLESALDVLDALRQLDPTYPNLATRAEQLRKARSAKRGIDVHLLEEDAGLAPTVVLANQRYEQLEEIGRGGMGIVYKARDRRLGRIVALKRLSETLREHPRAVEMFLREARAAAALNHPNIVTVYDADQEHGMLFITMELLDGHPLHRLLHQRGRMSAVEVARIGTQVCAGLEYAHVRGVIHRDIKTANLFLTTEQRAKIMDFGLAKLAEEVRRSASLIGGTPYYMAPEQTLGGKVDHRADLYALGATLFELSTGEVPFPDGDAHQHDRLGAARDPRELAPELDARLAALILELLERDPELRPQSAAAVGLRLNALQRGRS